MGDDALRSSDSDLTRCSPSTSLAPGVTAAQSALNSPTATFSDRSMKQMVAGKGQDRIGDLLRPTHAAMLIEEFELHALFAEANDAVGRQPTTRCAPETRARPRHPSFRHLIGHHREMFFVVEMYSMIY
jgi:hypothetical protein